MTEDHIKNSKRDFLWNMAGSLIYAFSSMFMAFAAMRLLGPEDGGIFGFGFSTLGQQIFIIAYFGLRPFHITDTSGQYSFGDYLMLRKITCFLALVFAGAYLLLLTAEGAYGGLKAAAIFLLCIYKTSDGYADVYESEAQRDGKLYIGGRGLFLRTLISMAGFLAMLLISGDLVLSALGALICQLSGLWLFNIRAFFREVPENSFDLHYSMKKVKELLISDMPLFLSVFLDFYIFSSAKYAIDWTLGDSASGIFNILFMPTSFIYLAANFIIKPFMTELAVCFGRRDRRSFLRLSGRMALVTALIMSAALIGALILGRPVLRLLEYILGDTYGGMLTGNFTSFILIILGGGIYALNNLFYYLLVIMRRQRLIFVIYLAGSAAAFLLSRAAVERTGIPGAAAAYVLLMLIILAAFTAAVYRSIKSGFQEKV